MVCKTLHNYEQCSPSSKIPNITIAPKYHRRTDEKLPQNYEQYFTYSSWTIFQTSLMNTGWWTTRFPSCPVFLQPVMFRVLFNTILIAKNSNLRSLLTNTHNKHNNMNNIVSILTSANINYEKIHVKVVFLFLAVGDVQ